MAHHGNILRKLAEDDQRNDTKIAALMGISRMQLSRYKTEQHLSYEQIGKVIKAYPNFRNMIKSETTEGLGYPKKGVTEKRVRAMELEIIAMSKHIVELLASAKLQEEKNASLKKELAILSGKVKKVEGEVDVINASLPTPT